MNEKILLIISISIYLLSLTQNAFFVDGSNPKSWSKPIGLIAFGWIGAFMSGGSALVWLANPLIFISWIYSEINITISAILAALASLIGFSFLAFDKVITSEKPTYSKIVKYKSGYWLWQISMTVFALGMIFKSI